MTVKRQAKYCPQCGTMAFLETPVCATCGYHYHTGVEAPAAAPVDPDDEDFNKTQLFMMSPVFTPRTDEPHDPVPVGPETATRAGWSKQQIYAMAAGIAVVLALLLWLGHNALVTPPAHPDAVVGRWARASARGTVGLMFAADGSGALFWQPAPGPDAAAKAGNVPLRWHQTPDGTLRFYPAQSAEGTDAQQAVDLLSSQAWPWSADARRLTLGKLSFARQGS